MVITSRVYQLGGMQNSMEMARSVSAQLQRLRKNSRIRANQEENITQGLKPGICFDAFAARLKSCPDAYRPTQDSFANGST
jgi:hypothetical protein